MNYWWVNHKQTVKQEVGGGYLWSPKTKSNGQKSRYYDFMRETRPGDLVVSFADARIKYIGQVSGYPQSAPQPKEFGDVGENWSNIGWHVSVDWVEANSPFRVKDHIREISELIPETYSPIQKNGNGNQAAYLTKISRELFVLIRSKASISETAFLSNSDTDHIEEVAEAFADAVEENINADLSLSDTEKETLAKARRGQGKFRMNLEKIEKSCRVSDLKNKKLLIASHIKPWSQCSSAAERLDGANGLLLAPHIDKLFDRGFISFEKNGSMLVSTELNNHTKECLGLGHAIAEGVGGFSNAQESYLEYHRGNVFNI